MGNNNTTIQHSPMKIIKKKFIWTIENFSARVQETGKCLKSGEFTSFSPSGQWLKWQLEIYPNGYNDEAKDFVSIYIRLIDSSYASQVVAKAEFCIRNFIGMNQKKCDTKYIKFVKNAPGWGFLKFIEREMLLNATNCPRDLLTIVCQVSICLEKMPEINVPESQIVKHISTLLDNDHLFDFTIISADNKEIKAHKNILTCRSPVFAAMFEHEMIETLNNKVEIPDFDENVLRQMLQFIYNENAVVFKNIEDKLLAAADKYELERLKNLCERELANSMCVENACQTLILASLYSAKQLKLYAIEYIRQHKKQVKASDGWEMLNEEHLQMLGFKKSHLMKANDMTSAWKIVVFIGFLVAISVAAWVLVPILAPATLLVIERVLCFMR